jgi:hypothetical protein
LAEAFQVKVGVDEQHIDHGQRVEEILWAPAASRFEFAESALLQREMHGRPAVSGRRSRPLRFTNGAGNALPPC